MTFPSSFPRKAGRLRRGGLLFITAVLLLLTACQPLLPTPPRLATRQAEPENGAPAPLATRINLPAPTPTGAPIATPPSPAADIDPNPVVTLWVNETSPAHRAALNQMGEALEEQHGIFLEAVLIDNGRLPDLVATAALSDTLPDFILHPLEYTVSWTEAGVLTPNLNQTLLERLGAETFDVAALRLATLSDGQITALPSDAKPQLLIYRADWFDALNLEPPDTYEKILAAADAIYRSETLSAQTGISSTLISGVVAPTESNLVSTQQVFEQIALANGCRLIDQKGEVTFLHPDCLDALDFYRDLINSYSPSDVQTDISALNAYLAGRTGMIFTSPSSLVALVGLDELYRPTCPQCAEDERFLLDNTGLVTGITGRSPAAGEARFSNLTYLGATRAADPELAAIFADYWFGEGYQTWLSVEPERKVPMRLGPAGDADRYRAAWPALPVRPGGPPLSDMYGPAVLGTLSATVSGAERWGFSIGQGALMGDLYEDLTFSILLQEMLSGYFTSSQAVIEGHQQVVDLIPNYAYITEPLPTPTEEAEQEE